MINVEKVVGELTKKETMKVSENIGTSIKSMIEAELPEVRVSIGINLGLCSFYAEKGGLLVGFEKM